MDKTQRIVEEQLVMTTDKAQERKKQSFKDTKVSVLLFSADISKSEDISRWQLIDKTLHYNFSVAKTFFKNCHIHLSEGLMFYPAMGSKRSKTKHSPRL